MHEHIPWNNEKKVLRPHMGMLEILANKKYLQKENFVQENAASPPKRNIFNL